MDPGNGMLGAAGILMAIHHRDRTGEGQFVECPQLGSAILSTAETTLRADGTIEDPILADPLQYGYDWSTRLYEAADGWILIDAPMRALGTLLKLTDAHDDNAADRIAAWVSGQAAEDAVAALKAANIPAIRLAEPYDGEQYFFDAENRRLDRVIQHRGHPVFDEYHELALFWRFPGLALRTGEAAWYAQPIGQHSRAILGEVGFNDAQIDELRDKKVIGAV